ncbi:MAG: type II toxin-antitoxin system RelE/ParE family toxin [Sphingomonadales bacterium]|nr:type II toxin-antitoxin system RelE/ParE family toxin [Sphingomonadales bacterium]
MAVLYTRTALRALARAPANIRERIRDKIALLDSDPEALANNVTRLVGSDAWRLRVGDWRVIYKWQGPDPVVLVVLDVGPRGRIYE